MTLIMAGPNLDIHVEPRDDVTLVSLNGPVDSATFDQFKQTLDPLCKGGGIKLVLNCRNLSYMNSKGIGLLASLHRSALINMGNIVLACLNHKIVKTLDLLGLGKRLKIFEDVDEAIASLKQQ